MKAEEVSHMTMFLIIIAVVVVSQAILGIACCAAAGPADGLGGDG